MEKSKCSNCLRVNIMEEMKIVYSENDIIIKDENENIIKVLSHDDLYENKKYIIEDNDYIKYCPECDNTSGFPCSYDNNEHIFKTYNNNTISYYDNYLEDNIIHNFDNIQCKYCSQKLLKGFYSHEIITEEDIISKNLSIPYDVNKPVKIYSHNLNGLENKDNYYIKDIYFSKYEDNFITNKFTSVDGCSTLYCPTCNYCIINSLETIE